MAGIVGAVHAEDHGGRWQFQAVALNKDGRDAAAGSCACQLSDAQAFAVDALTASACASPLWYAAL